MKKVGPIENSDSFDKWQSAAVTDYVNLKNVRETPGTWLTGSIHSVSVEK